MSQASRMEAISSYQTSEAPSERKTIPSVTSTAMAVIRTITSHSSAFS